MTRNAEAAAGPGRSARLSYHGVVHLEKAADKLVRLELSELQHTLHRWRLAYSGCSL